MEVFICTESACTPFLSRNSGIVHVFVLMLIACLLFLTPYQIAVAQTVHIPDPNLRAVLELALSKEVGADITQVDMASLKTLEAVKSGIRDLTGIEFAVNLTELELGDNHISDLSLLSTLTNLTRLRLGANHEILSVSPLKDLTNLTFLDIDSNKISDVSPLSTLTNLRWLDLDDNRISDLSPLSTLTSLRYLDLDGNQISDVSPLRELTNLTFLDIDENAILDVSPLSVLTKLTVLDLEGNKLSDLSPLITLTNLTELDLHNNQISDLSPLGALTNLTELDLHDNQISDVSPLGALTHLTVLDLSGNQISDFSPIAGLIENLVEYDNSNQTIPSNTADVNRDGIVNILDLILVASHYGNPNFADAAGAGIYPDVNGDGIIDVRDLVAIAAEINPDTAAPMLRKQVLETSSLTAARLVQWIVLAKQLDVQASHTQRGIAVLERLLASIAYDLEVIPKATVLLSNYPNPFNPETWIPYELSTPASVAISIYSGEGQLIRRLALGHLSAGVYRSKSRAAYWDGRNELGESVASGVYFYTFRADDFIATGKMLIRK